MADPTRVDSVFKARALQREAARTLMASLFADLKDSVRAQVRSTLERSGSLLYVVSHMLDAARMEIEDMWYRGDVGIADERRMLGDLEEAVAAVASQLEGGGVGL